MKMRMKTQMTQIIDKHLDDFSSSHFYISYIYVTIEKFSVIIDIFSVDFLFSLMYYTRFK